MVRDNGQSGVEDKSALCVKTFSQLIPGKGQAVVAVEQLLRLDQGWM
jgi:hypothetical protein